MENANKQICRLCLELILDGDYEVIEERKKEILDTLLIKIDFDISDNVFACKKCLVKLQDCYEFKSNCLYLNDYVTPFVEADVKVDIKNVFEKVTMTSENVSLDNSQMCRFCMSFIEDEAFNCYTSNLKDMIRNCLPDVNLNSADEPLVCKSCLSNMTRYYEFMKSCEEVEQKIKNYIQEGEDHGIASKIILEDVLELKMCGTLSKPLEKQCLDPENETKCLKNEEDVNIKYEEIEIKDELDIDCDQCTYSTNYKGHLHRHKRAHQKNDIKQIYKCKLCDYQAKARVSIKDHMIRIHTDPSKVQTLKCSFCPYKSILKSALSQHIRKRHIESVKCDKCDFRTKHKENLLQHMKLHGSDKAPKFKCDKCEYSTWRKRNFNQHKVRHMELRHTIVYKCKLCNYQAKANRTLKNHMITIHMDPSKVPTFKCALCPYEGTAKRYLYQHIKRWHNHKDQLAFECSLCLYVTTVKENLRTHSCTQHELIRTIKCDQCDFRTKHKSYLQIHMKLHESVEPPMFKCDKCEYRTWRKGNFERHKVTHMEQRQTIVYTCKLCNYQAKANRTLKNHMAIHMDPSKVPTFKCAHCPYESTVKDYLSKHITRRHNHKDQLAFECTLCPYVTKVKENLRKHSRSHELICAIKCDQCDFRTKQKGNLQQHMKLHEPVKPPMLKCDKCEYSTWHQGNFKKHKVTHMELGQDIAYKCKLCEYQAKASISLKNHMITIHMDPSKVPKFKCALCPYEGTAKKYLSQHIKRWHNHKDQSTLRHMKLHNTVKSPTIKCDKCEYSTWRKSHLNLHKLRHLELSETIA